MADAWEVWAAMPLEGAEVRLIEWSFWEDAARRIARNLERMGMVAVTVRKVRRKNED